MKIIRFLKARYAPRGARISFSASGEDIVLSDILKRQGIVKPFYLDIGAHDPIYGNNTYLLYRQGGRGILVEPNKSLSDKGKMKRPGDVCINAGVGEDVGESDFYIFDKRSTRSTFLKSQADEWEMKSGEKPRVEKLPVLSLDAIISHYSQGRVPDLVSIDAEGFDMRILQGWKGLERPKVFCIELSSGIEELMQQRGYRLEAHIFQNGIFAIQ